MPVRVPLSFVRPSMRLARGVFDAEGRVVAGAGTQLADRVVRTLVHSGVETVLVADGVEVREWETVRPLADELAALDARFGSASPSGALAELHAALARRLRRRAERLAAEEAAPESGGDVPPPVAKS